VQLKALFGVHWIFLSHLTLKVLKLHSDGALCCDC